MDRWRGRVALVTGASRGIGEGIARVLVSHGMTVVGCARNVAKVQAIANDLSDQPGSLYGIRCDLRREEDILAMFAEIKKKYGGVDVCINNAGLWHRATGTLLSGETEKWREMLEVNVLAVSICTREAYKSMAERGVNDGHIIHINSGSGHQVGVMTFYSATKFALTALTEGLRNELRQANSHIRISSISPGYVKAGFLDRRTKQKDLAQKMSQMHLDPVDIGNTVAYILGTPPHVQIHDVMVQHTCEMD